MDVNTDHFFPILEAYGDQAEALDLAIMEEPDQNVMQEIHQLKRDLLLMRHSIWPMREVVSSLMRDSHEYISETTRTYLRDLYDHVIQIIDIIEVDREYVSDLTENYMSSVSNRMNEVS